MCKAKSYTEQIIEIYNNINSDVKRLRSEVRTASLFNLDMLHTIMNTKFNACEGYKLAKQIQDNQLFRQNSKYELATLLQLKKHIDSNKELLNLVHQEIINKDASYKYNIENKIYYPRVKENDISKPVDEIESKPQFIPIPIPSFPSTPKPIPKTQGLPIMLGDAIHKKTNAKMKVISKIDDGHYLVKVKNGYQVICSKHIVSLEFQQSAK